MSLPVLQAADQHVGRLGQMDVIVKSLLEARLLESIPWKSRLRTLVIGSKTSRFRKLAMMRSLSVLRLVNPDIFATLHVTNSSQARSMARVVGARINVVTGDIGTQNDRYSITPLPGEHKTIFYARFLTAAGLDVDLKKLSFPRFASNVSAGRLEDRKHNFEKAPRILLAPAVGDPNEQHKRWPSYKFSRLAEEICHICPEMRLELVGAPHERSLLEEVFAGIDISLCARVDIRTEPTPMQAAAAMIGASCIVTACSGASHLAAWADIPIVGLYGPTNPCFTGPFSNKLYVVRKGWRCSPCYRSDFTSGCANPICMQAISVGEVVEMLRSALAGRAPSPLPILTNTMATSPDPSVI